MDFKLDYTGELQTTEDHDLETVSDVEYKIQTSYDIIKSVSTTWFYDNIGANLEQHVGEPVTPANLESIKQQLIHHLTANNLWNTDDILVTYNVKKATKVIFSVFLRLYTNDKYKEESREIEVELDLIKGVNIRYGW